MNKKTVAYTVLFQIVCLSVIVGLVRTETNYSILAYQLEQTQTPVPFLGSIYYGNEALLAVFDHELPLFRPTEDFNNNVRHYNGVTYLAVTPTPAGDPYIPNTGYGYDQHVGVDYTLRYEPVLAAANGTVAYAGWSNPSNHRVLYGLHVQMLHDANTAYRAWYGHLSTLVVETGDVITINPADPGNRNRILGISGNTGRLQGCNEPVGDDPLCSAHLHFEVRQRNTNRPVNPYGWVGLTPMPGATPVIDPWSVYVSPQGTPAGATSYNLWATRPAITTNQYGTGDAPLNEPPLSEAQLIIDDSSADFTTTLTSCWDTAVGDNSYNGTYRYAATDPGTTCFAWWHIRPDAFSPPGAYDVFVHIPAGENRTWGAEYTIRHQNETSVAIVVQAAYPNTEHDAWAYIGRYDFAMDSATEEYVRLTGHTTIEDDKNRFVLADVIKLVPANPTPPPVDVIYVSFANDGVAGNVAYADEDILAYDTRTGTWSMVLDGSDVRLGDTNIDAIHIANGKFLFSIDTPVHGFDDADIIAFTPTSLGENSAGTLSVLYTSTDLFLTAESEDIDAIAFTPNGTLTLSAIGDATETGNPVFADEDLFNYYPHALTHLRLYFDGSDELLTNESEDVNGTWIDPDTGDIYLTTNGVFRVDDISGDGADIFVCDPLSLGSMTDCAFGPGLFWNGSAHGLGGSATPGVEMPIDAIFLGDIGECSSFSNGGFEAQFFCWQVEFSAPDFLWRPSSSAAHTGQYSAAAEAGALANCRGAHLVSSLIPVNFNHAYRFQFYGKGPLRAVSGEPVHIDSAISWYDDAGNPVDYSLLITHSEPLTEWTLITPQYICPPDPAIRFARIRIEIEGCTLLESFAPNSGEVAFYADDVVWNALPDTCPLH